MICTASGEDEGESKAISHVCSCPPRNTTMLDPSSRIVDDRASSSGHDRLGRSHDQDRPRTLYRDRVIADAATFLAVPIPTSDVAALPGPVFLVRHGETAWNALGRLQGHTDIGLNEKGRQQAEVLAEDLREAGIGHVVSSDLARAHDTARIVVERLGITGPIVVDPDLRERGFGVFEGLTREECQRQHEAAWRAWLETREAPPGGEPTPSVLARVDRAMRRAAQVAGAGRCVLVMSHGGSMRLWLGAMTGVAIDAVGNGSIYRVRFGETVIADRWPVVDP